MTTASLNGRLSAAQLVTIDTAGHQLAGPAAAAYTAALAAGMPAGGVRDAYRSFARQQTFYAAPPNRAGLAAVPGTSSHGWGLALDLDDDQAVWLLAHPEFGFRRTITVEPWHLEFFAPLYTHQPTTVEDDMGLSPEALAQIATAAHDAMVSVIRSPEFAARVQQETHDSVVSVMRSAEFSARLAAAVNSR